jgi:glucosamine 6-phosphate synthetase-like amidotransferase/phosphosugar isomerase protein
MCGVFGYIRKNNDFQSKANFDNGLVSHIALLSAERGPHAWGIAWRDFTGMYCYKQPRRLEDTLIINNLWANAMIGHCRLATDGNYKEVSNNQPIMINQVALAHNGIVKNYKYIKDREEYPVSTENDSEILLWHYLRYKSLDKLKILSEPNYALILMDMERVILTHNKLPIYIREDVHHVYFCSKKFDKSILLRNEEVRSFAYAKT